MENQNPSYADMLRAAIDRKTNRTRLSRALAEKTGAKQSSEYRSIGKYLRGPEQPDKKRAAILAVLLEEPELALVSAVAERRQVRRAELEERVERLERALNLLGPDLRALATLPERVLALERPAQTKKRQGGQ